MAHIVTAPLAVVGNSNGRTSYVYQGSRVPDGVPAKELERLVGLGLVSEVEDAKPVPGVGEDGAPRRSTPAAKPKA